MADKSNKNEKKKDTKKKLGQIKGVRTTKFSIHGGHTNKNE